MSSTKNLNNNTKEKENDIRIEKDLLSVDFSKGVHFDENNNIKRNSGLVGDCYVCIRPGNRTNVPKINCKKKHLNKKNPQKETIIASNYGHGGIGWSLMWGSCQTSIKFSEILNVKNYKKIIS
jgi:hypothetical protein